ncbi:MAG: K(+)-transporting ATPase subunit F [Gammaproteobacteria bacterium]|nr:K(+)-transporting ATPase subunit F [Gammaproteobacteria bacterium]
MSLFAWFGLVVGVGIVLYLFVFLLNPEKFL